MANTAQEALWQPATMGDVDGAGRSLSLGAKVGAGAQVDARDHEGRAALMWAAASGNAQRGDDAWTIAIGGASWIGRRFRKQSLRVSPEERAGFEVKVDGLGAFRGSSRRWTS